MTQSSCVILYACYQASHCVAHSLLIAIKCDLWGLSEVLNICIHLPVSCVCIFLLVRRKAVLSVLRSLVSAYSRRKGKCSDLGHVFQLELHSCKLWLGCCGDKHHTLVLRKKKAVLSMSWPGCLLPSAYQWWCLLLTPQSPPSPSWASAIWRPIEHCQLLSVPRTEVMEKWACSGHQLMCNTFQFQIHSVCYTSPSWNWNWLRINISNRWMLDQLVVKNLHYFWWCEPHPSNFISLPRCLIFKIYIFRNACTTSIGAGADLLVPIPRAPSPYHCYCWGWSTC